MKNTFPNSVFIAIVVLFASIGYAIFPIIIKTQIIQFSTIPDTISFKLYDALKKDTATFNLQVVSNPLLNKFKVDSTKTKTLVRRDVLFHENPAFMIWSVLIAITLTVAGGSAPVFYMQNKQLKKRFQLTKQQSSLIKWLSVGICFLLIISNLYTPGYYKPPDVLDDFHILLKDGYILKWIEFTCILLMFPSMMLIISSAVSSDNISTGVKIEAQAKELTYNNDELIHIAKCKILRSLRDFNFLNQTMNNALQLLAIIVVFSVITSGILGYSVNAMIEIKGIQVYPKEICYVYGLFFSLFLCVIYFPAYIYLQSRYNQFKNLIYEFNESQLNEDEKWLQTIEAQIQFKSTALDNFKLALTVLAPLLSSFLPENLHFIK